MKKLLNSRCYVKKSLFPAWPLIAFAQGIYELVCRVVGRKQTNYVRDMTSHAKERCQKETSALRESFSRM